MREQRASAVTREQLAAEREQEAAECRLREEKLRQKVREESSELRELESLLKTAAVCKEREVQTKTLKQMKEMEKVMDYCFRSFVLFFF